MDHRERILTAVAAADPQLPLAHARAAVDAVLTHPAVTRELAAALAADPDALSVGAPPVIGRLLADLRTVGSSLPAPGCVRCGRSDRPLTRSSDGGVCPRCRRRQLATSCTRCGVVKPVAARDEQHRPLCARCADRPQRRCGRCGRTRRIARRATATQPDICDGCFRGREAVCTGCGRRRPCVFDPETGPTCQACRPRTLAECAHCGQHRAPTARWPEGPVCDPCYTAALRRRGHCTACGDLRADTEHVPDALTAVYEAIVTTSTPRSALNWLRRGAGARVLAELAGGQLAVTHQALDAHPHRRAADYLREVLTANHVLPERDEALVGTERFLTELLAGIDHDADRRMVAAFATWQVLRRLRRRAEQRPRPRTHTHRARAQISSAAQFLAWLAGRGIRLPEATQADLDTWLATGPAAYQVRDFLGWAGEHGHCRPLHVPPPARATGAATSDDERFAQLTRLLHDADIELTDRVVGTLLLLYGQPLSRIAAITTDQITHRGNQIFLRFGHHDVHLPEPLAGLVDTLTRNGRRYRGVGSPSTNSWLFPGHLPGRALTAARLGERLRTLSIHAQPGRRAALTSLAAQLPAAVLAELLNLHPTTAVRWVRDAGGDWNNYAAQLIQAHDHQLECSRFSGQPVSQAASSVTCRNPSSYSSGVK